MERPSGLEPPTYAFGGRCSSSELWAQCLVPPEGLEPPRRRLRRPTAVPSAGVMFGEGGGIRTHVEAFACRVKSPIPSAAW